MTLKVSTDIGGTFTDITVSDELGNVHVYKSPTVPGNYSEGVISAVKKASESLGISSEKLLQNCSLDGGRFVHGSTITTNAIVENKVGKVGLICTRGHRDILTLRSGGEKSNPYNLRMDYPKPFVPRYLTMEVTERIDAEGNIIVPLCEDDVRLAIKRFKEYNVQSIAVCLLWDIANPVHGNRIGEIIKEEWEDIPVVLSHEFNPVIQELKRTSSTSINAALLPVIGDYLKNLEKEILEAGYSNNLSILNIIGGVMTVEEMLRSPIYSIGSGPAMAPVAGLEFSRLEKNSNNVIVVDMGGTSFDISTVVNGEVSQSRDTKIDHYDLGIASVDIDSVGSGGGSIAWVDTGGMLRVGPESAGSTPGPACYGLGGTRPTVTDANLVLGYLNEDFFVGGSMKLYPKLAEEAIIKYVGDPLGLSLQEAAYSIWHTVNSDMSACVEERTVWEGIDPRNHVFVAGGGASGLHIVQICKQIGVKEAIIPKVSGALSASGGLYADVVGEYSIGDFVNSDELHNNELKFSNVNNSLKNLESWAKAFLKRSRIPKSRQRIEFYCEARYSHQNFELTVPLKNNQFINSSDINRLIEDFHHIHERVFAFVEDTQQIECVNWRVKAIGIVEKPELQLMTNVLQDSSEGFIGTRDVYLDPNIGEVQADVYRGETLTPGCVIPFEKTAIIEERTTTILCLPGCQLTVSPYGNYNLEFQE